MSHVSVRNEPELIEKLYMTVVDDGDVKPFLSELAQAYGASLASLATMDGNSRHDSLRISSAVDLQQTARTVPSHYAARSPFRPVMLREENYGRIMTSSQMVSAEQRARDVFINEFLKPENHEYLLTGIFGQSNGRHNYVVLNRGSDAGEFDDEQVMGLQELVPHLRTMLRLRNKMMTRERHLDLTRQMADHRGDGMVLLDRRGVVHSMNAHAETLLAESDGLNLNSCRLEAALPEDDASLKQAIQALLRGDAAGHRMPAISVVVRRPSGAQPWRLHIMPLSLRKLIFAGDEIELAVQIVGPSVAGTDIDGTLADQFGLSNAEMRVMTHLVAGVSPKKIADLLGNSVNTIKVHRRNLYRKLGISRHFDLVRMANKRA